ncbi:tyrosine-type recombinase/integrase [Dactylosporangium sp. NPDC049140]|uniref:tyrosine-type recombinase/integrase n=1 Tax=Dactylosporangium sp. NPDC049140 TaxID=3155647 RepID=UPI0033DA7120
MRGSTFKRCGCRDQTSGRRLGQRCPQLRRSDGAWSRSHGQWHWQIDIPPRADGTRRVLRHGAYPTQADANTILDQIRAALAVPDPTDEYTVTRTGDLIENAVNAGAPIPTPDELRRWLHLDITPTELPTVEAYLTEWLSSRKKIKHGTLRGYETHIRRYLIPHLGHRRIDRLRPSHIDAMYELIEEHNSIIRTLRASPDQATRDQVLGQRTVGVNTLHRIHATLRKALNDAITRYRYIDINPARMVELPPAQPPKPTVWTDQRVATWRETGKVPSPVMIWTPAQTGRFLDHAHHAQDRLYALYHLVTFTGLRRGEACGLRWDDADLEAGTITIHHLATQAGLPPIRLHDLRHGAATMGLAAGVEMRVISHQLRHASPHFTAKFYGAVLPEVAHAAAEATAAIVPRQHRPATRSA